MIMVLLICLLSAGCNDASTLTMEEKVQDFEQLYDTIKTGYPYLDVNKRLNGVDWLANKETYLKKIKATKNDRQFIKTLETIVLELNNDHSHVVSNIYEFKVYKDSYKDWYDFFDDPKVNARYPDKFNIFDLLSIFNSSSSSGSINLKDIKEGSIGYIYIPSMKSSGEDITNDMKKINEYIQGRKDYNALVIDIRGNQGGNENYWFTLMSMILPSSYSESGYMLFKDNDVINNYIKAKHLPKKPITELPADVLKNAPAEVSSAFKYYDTKEISLSSTNSINFKGKLFLLTDKSVYSSAESFAIFCKETKAATLIGETTGGDGGGIDPVLFKLDNSGLIVRMSSNMYLTGSGICNEEFKTVPDYIIENPKRTKIFNNDKCIAKVLELMK